MSKNVKKRFITKFKKFNSYIKIVYAINALNLNINISNINIIV